MIKLSKRLSHLADMVSENMVLADVGTDHGYIPIYLVQSGRIKKAFAMDIRKGPLLRAEEHIRACGLGDYITTRLSDGVASLTEKEPDSILIAGMGGNVMLHILEEGETVISSARELILQPQSEITKVRKYLYQKGYAIDREEMVFEDGKYYPMMKAVHGENTDDRKIWFLYGRLLLENRHPVLKSYLEKEYDGCCKLLEKLSRTSTEAAKHRCEELSEKKLLIEEALVYFREAT